jgi:O-antigen ligase
MHYTLLNKFGFSSDYTVLNNISYLSLLTIAFIFPFGIGLLPYLLWFAGLAWLLEGKLLIKTKNAFTKKILFYYFILFLVFYLLHLLSVFNSANSKEAWFDIQVKLAIVVFPFIIFTSNDLIKKKINNILIALLAGTIIAVLICFFNSLFQSFHLSDGHLVFRVHPGNQDWNNYFLADYFSVFHHPSYFAMFISLSIAIVFYLGFSKRDIVNLQWWQYILLLIFLSVALFLVSSRAGLIIWAMIIIYFFISDLTGRYTFNEKILSFLPLVLLAGVLVFLLINGSRFRVVADEISNIEKDRQKGECTGSSEIRVVMWGRGLEIIKDNFLLGTGTGDVKDKLQRNAEIEGYSIVKDRNFNVHNQYLETWMGIGVFGFVLLLLLLFIPLFFRSRHYLLPYLIIILSTSFLFESMLNRLAGVMFFSFFLSLLVFCHQQEEVE